MVEQNKNNVIVGEYLDLFFNPFASIGATTEGFGKEVDLPYEVNLEFGCREIPISPTEKRYEERLRVGKGQVADKRIINFVYGDFSEEKTKKLYVFSKPFEMPFRVADLIYAFGEDEKYCFVYDTQSNEIVNEIIGDIRNIFGDDIWNSNFGAMNIMNIGNCPNNARRISFSPSSTGDVRIMDDSGGNFNYGRVIFYEGGIAKESKFIGFPMIEAAIFSDHEVYASCNFDRLMKKIDKVAELYKVKADTLKITQVCSYETLKTDLIAIQSAAGSSDSNPDAMEELYNAADTFTNRNKNFNCAQIY